jgi:MerR HTH family regulatory protein
MVKRQAAAVLLGVGPDVLEEWGQRFGFPRPRLLEDGDTLYSRSDVMALRAALETGLSIPSAIRAAQHALSTDDRSLRSGLPCEDRGRTRS